MQFINIPFKFNFVQLLCVQMKKKDTLVHVLITPSSRCAENSWETTRRNQRAENWSKINLSNNYGLATGIIIQC